MEPNTEQKTERKGVAVFCKCGRIIWVVTHEYYLDAPEVRSKMDAYFDKGYQVAMVNTSQVRELWGCKCA